MMKGFCFLRNYNEWRLTDRLLIEIKIIILIHFEIFFAKFGFFPRQTGGAPDAGDSVGEHRLCRRPCRGLFFGFETGGQPAGVFGPAVHAWFGIGRVGLGAGFLRRSSGGYRC